jgi:endonuclease/exonuclease/phosphatase family metal-dependent hydrolase
MKSISTSGLQLTSLLAILACAAGCGEPFGNDQGELEGEHDNALELGQAEQAVIAPIEIITINVRIPEDGGDNSWANRLNRIRDTIKYYRSGAGPHLIGAQELRSATFTDLHNALGTYWGTWVDRGDGERIAIWVDTSRFVVEDWNWRVVTNSQRDGSCGLTDDEDPAPRAIQFVRVHDSLTNRVFTVYNTHYPSKNSCERYGMSTIFSNYIYETAVGDVILLGDFNDGINTNGSYNGSFAQLLADQGNMISAYDDVNSVSSSARKLTGHGYNKTARTGKMIDHIVVDSWIDVQASEVSHLMYTGSPGTRVPCSVVDFNPAGTPSCGSPFSQYNPNALKMYSDHWAVWARITP